MSPLLLTSSTSMGCSKIENIAEVRELIENIWDREYGEDTRGSLCLCALYLCALIKL